MRPATQIHRRAAFLAALREIVEYHRGRIVELNDMPHDGVGRLNGSPSYYTHPETTLESLALIAFHKRAVAAIQVVVLREEAG